MKKAVLVVVALILIFTGLYGAYYFLNLKKAEALINAAIINISEAKYDRAIKDLKTAAATYNYAVVKAPALYLLAQTYQKKGTYTAAAEVHKSLISNQRLHRNNNWYIRSIISLSRLYRRGMVKASEQQTQALEKYITMIKEKIEERSKCLDSFVLGRYLGQSFNELISLNYNLHMKDLTDKEALRELQQELGLLYLETHNYDKAKLIFSRLDTPVSKWGLARVYIRTGEQEKGLSLLEDLLSYDSDGKIRSYYLSEAYQHAVRMYNDKKYSSAVDLFEKVVKYSSNGKYSELALLSLARYYYGKKMHSRTLSYVESILENTVALKDQQALLLKGYIYYEKTDYVRALKIFNEFIKKYPHSESIDVARKWKKMCERSIKYLN